MISPVAPESNARSDLGADTLATWLGLFVEPGQVTELRALRVVQRYGRPQTVAGFFDAGHLDDMAAQAIRLTPEAAGVYFIPNALSPDLLARRCNRVAAADTGLLAGDGHVIARRWLLVDADPVRVGGVSATDAEKANAARTIRAVRDWLRGRGWPGPVLADSGNGFHLLYRIDLPADDGALVRRALRALAARFDTDAVKIDQAVYNAARIVKLYGTASRKGDSTPERPHRRSRVLEVPGCPDPLDVAGAALVPVPRELLEQLAGEAPAEARPAVGPAPTNGEYRHRLKVPEWLAARGFACTAKLLPDGRTAYLLDRCPFNADHVGKDVAIFQWPAGKLGARCLHNSCSGNHWQQFKDRIGPPDADHYDPPLPRGHQAGGRRPAAANGEARAGPDQRSTVLLIREWILAEFQPTFRREGCLYSARLAREVRSQEVTGYPTSDLIAGLAAALDAPRDRKGHVDVQALPGHYRRWAPTAWADVLRGLPEEEEAGEVTDAAAEAFRRQLSAALNTIVALGHSHKGDGERTETQRRALIDWAVAWAKPGPWRDVRSYRLWHRLDDQKQLQVALRSELFSQLGRRDLTQLSQRKLVALAERYGVGKAGKACGERVLVLRPAYVAQLRSGPTSADSWTEEWTEAWTEGNSCVHPSKSDGTSGAENGRMDGTKSAPSTPSSTGSAGPDGSCSDLDGRAQFPRACAQAPACASASVHASTEAEAEVGVTEEARHGNSEGREGPSGGREPGEEG
jgi:hypothetical protein